MTSAALVFFKLLEQHMACHSKLVSNLTSTRRNKKHFFFPLTFRVKRGDANSPQARVGLHHHHHYHEE
jgi:hypothetical protein